MNYLKPDVLPAWGENNQTNADMVQPAAIEVAAGWPQSPTPPSRQRFNWILHWLANAVRYFMQRGIPDWDGAETYTAGCRVIGDDGHTYSSLQGNNQGNTPSTSPLWWERWALTLAEVNASQLTQATLAAGDNSIKLPNTSWVRTFVANALQPLWEAINAKSGPLGFVPVEQSGGVGQVAGKVQIGANGVGGLKASVDGGDLGNIAFDTGFIASKNANGYLKLPGGMILQWCKGNAQNANAPDSGTQDINFPMAFPTACLSVQATTYTSTNTIDGNSWFQVLSYSTTKVRTQLQQADNTSVAGTTYTPLIFAIGY